MGEMVVLRTNSEENHITPFIAPLAIIAQKALPEIYFRSAYGIIPHSVCISHPSISTNIVSYVVQKPHF
jgi:hypothetical protein